jgi:hypothetical protein
MFIVEKYLFSVEKRYSYEHCVKRNGKKTNNGASSSGQIADFGPR